MQLTQVDQSTKDTSERKGYYDVRVSTLSIVDHEQWYRCNDGNRQLMAPSNIEDIVKKTQQSGHE